jgi:hypothetical protein
MSRFRAYIQPFNPDGTYSGTWIDISDDVDFESIGQIQRQLDANAYDVGVFKFAQFPLTLFNRSGRYSDPTVFQSLFKFSISGTLFKMTWDANDYYCRAGMCTAGAVELFQETEIFRGLFDDTAGQMDIDTQKVQYQVLGLESEFDTNVNPGTLSNSDIFSVLIYKILNQSGITSVMTVDALNITCGIDGLTVDDVTKYDGKTVKEIMDNLLFLSNSVCYVNAGIVYVQPRSPAGSSKATFYGQASNNGIENIITIQNLNTGRPKMFNYWTWKDATPISQDVSSIKVNGVSKKEVDGIDEILTTNTTLIQTLLDAYKAEYKDNHQEFDLTTPVRNSSLGLYLLDHVSVDYPTVLIPADSNPLPLYSVATYGSSKYPIGQWQLTIPATDNYQIIGWTVDVPNQNFIFTLRKF